MFAKLGLQARMAISYMAVTVVAVVVAEGVVIGVLLPGLVGTADLQNRVSFTAGEIAQDVYRANRSLDPRLLQLPPGFQLGSPDAHARSAAIVYSGQGIQVPLIDQRSDDSTIVTTALVVSTDATVLATSNPGKYPVGRGAVDLPNGALNLKSAVKAVDPGRLVWATVRLLPPDKAAVKGEPAAASDGWGWIYVQAPDTVPLGFFATVATPTIVPGLLLLAITVPIGMLFGIVSTRRTVRRLERLAEAGERMGTGDFEQRVRTGPEDEVGRLERQFNLMAEALAAARAAERRQVEERARGAERERIARELHDAVSQDLFSLGMLAGGMEKALPAGTPLHEQARAMQETVESAVQEMHALLLELRPSVLDEQGLVPALRALCDAYQARVGVSVEADVEAVRLSLAGELALLRVAQEGVSNAVRHAEASRVQLQLRRQGDLAELTIADDGRGFDPRDGGRHGLGLRLMRERVTELGGTLDIDSAQGQGTRVRVSLPAVAL